MNRSLGGVEKQVVSLAQSNNVSVDHIVKHFAYTNDLKLECLKLFNAKNLNINNEAISNCVSKFNLAEGLLADISNKINA